MDIEGSLDDLLIELAQIIYGLAHRANIPKELLEAVIKTGFELDCEEGDFEEIDELEEKKEIVKELLQRMRDANKKEFDENNNK